MLDIRSEILEIAQRHLERVRASGSENVMALCPFHEDNTASFAMNTLNGVYFCHSCHAKGNLQTFLRGVGISRATIDLQYREIIEEARRATPAAPDPMDPGVYTLDVLPDSLLGHFDGYNINSLLEKGFTEQTIRNFDVGYDRWHARITYPIRDIKGNLVGINGRALYPGMNPRYKIYDSEYTQWGLPARTKPWNRRKVLYNAHAVLPAFYAHAPGQGSIVVVEGYKACAWVWQAGVKDVVALMGSYLSWEHRWMLDQFSGRVYLFLDNNNAGIQGTLDAGMQLNHWGSSLATYVVQYPARLAEDRDAQPDNLTPEEIWEQLSLAVPFVSWRSTKKGR